MKLKVVTFNLRMNTLYDGSHYFFNRSPFILKMLKEEKPDIIGFQEATREIHAWLLANFSEYTFVGVGRDADFSGEANPIAFLTNRFDLFCMHQFWLSPTPDIPGSRYEHQSICPRVCVSARLIEKKSGEVIRFYNTHLDHIDAEARRLGISQILSTIESDYQNAPCPVILTGDMNAEPDEISMQAVRDATCPVLVDASGDLKHTFHGYHGGSPYEGDGKIDYIYTNLVSSPILCDVWDGNENGLYLSDHYPIMAELDTDLLTQ